MAINLTARVILIIGFAQTVSLVLFKAYRNDTQEILKLVAKLGGECEKASKKWRKLSFKEKQRLYPKLERCKFRYAGRYKNSILPFASMPFDLLNTCYVCFGSGNSRRVYLYRIIAILEDVHRYFDKNLQNHEEYQKGLFLAYNWGFQQNMDDCLKDGKVYFTESELLEEVFESKLVPSWILRRFAPYLSKTEEGYSIKAYGKIKEIYKMLKQGRTIEEIDREIFSQIEKESHCLHFPNMKIFKDTLQNLNELNTIETGRESPCDCCDRAELCESYNLGKGKLVVKNNVLTFIPEKESFSNFNFTDNGNLIVKFTPDNVFHKKVEITPEQEMQYSPKNNEIEGKHEMSEIPLDLLAELLCPAYKEGCIKYFKNSWRKGFKISTMMDACLRHLSKFYYEGLDYDQETLEKYQIKKHHLGAATFAIICMFNDLQNHPKNDDRRFNKETS